MAFREVRIKEWNNRLAFRYNPETNTIELVERQRKVFISLDDYRPAHGRRADNVGLNFERIEGDDNVRD